MENAREELKRIDHLIYVTLKYTRTVDVFLSIIERMINAYEFVVDALIKKLVDEGKLMDKPDIPLAMAQIVLESYDSKRIKKNIEKYLLFRKLRRANYEKRNEFRRHVTMSAMVEGNLVEVDIDNITEDFHKLKEFIEYIEKMHVI
ncbi:hypothetical protein JXC34_02890 [Candidatus Woesearchaeota archaeon]|nr:hypothetical protein [Candidatus Woesearchaeota archaeon]